MADAAENSMASASMKMRCNQEGASVDHKGQAMTWDCKETGYHVELKNGVVTIKGGSAGTETIQKPVKRGTQGHTAASALPTQIRWVVNFNAGRGDVCGKLYTKDAVFVAYDYPEAGKHTVIKKDGSHGKKGTIGLWSGFASSMSEMQAAGMTVAVMNPKKKKKWRPPPSSRGPTGPPARKGPWLETFWARPGVVIGTTVGWFTGIWFAWEPTLSRRKKEMDNIND